MGQSINYDVNSEFKLINFNVPKYLIKNFDNMVKFKRVSRTSILIGMMESYLRNEYRRIKEDNQLNDLIVDIEKRNTKPIIKQNTERPTEWSVNKKRVDDYEPPMIPSFNDDDDESWMRGRW